MERNREDKKKARQPRRIDEPILRVCLSEQLAFASYHPTNAKTTQNLRSFYAQRDRNRGDFVIHRTQRNAPASCMRWLRGHLGPEEVEWLTQKSSGSLHLLEVVGKFRRDGILGSRGVSAGNLPIPFAYVIHYLRNPPYSLRHR